MRHDQSPSPAGGEVQNSIGLLMVSSNGARPGQDLSCRWLICVAPPIGVASPVPVVATGVTRNQNPETTYDLCRQKRVRRHIDPGRGDIARALSPQGTPRGPARFLGVPRNDRLAILPTDPLPRYKGDSPSCGSVNP